MEKTYQQIALFQETIEPEQAISYVIEQFKTGPCCPKPMVYENYYYGSATDQIFGVPLEEVAQAYGSYVPPIISRGIKYIDKGTESMKIDQSYVTNHLGSHCFKTNG
jgi:hypothetical protein